MCVSLSWACTYERMCMAMYDGCVLAPSIPPFRILSRQNGDTPLILSLQKGYTEIAGMLLAMGAGKDAKESVSNYCLAQPV